jgi:hypothetical protein
MIETKYLERMADSLGRQSFSAGDPLISPESN